MAAKKHVRPRPRIVSITTYVRRAQKAAGLHSLYKARELRATQ